MKSPEIKNTNIWIYFYSQVSLFDCLFFEIKLQTPHMTKAPL